MAQDWGRSVFMKRRSANFARRPGSAACGVCRWEILLTILYEAKAVRLVVAAAFFSLVRSGVRSEKQFLQPGSRRYTDSESNWLENK